MLDISGLNRGRSAISKLIHIELMGEEIDEPIFLATMIRVSIRISLRTELMFGKNS